jgi:hypothetical protein
VRRYRVLVPIVLVGALASGARGAGQPAAANVTWGERMVAEVQPANNLYGSHPTIVRWTENGQEARNRSVCSSFQTHVFEKAYGLHEADIVRWFGMANPQAKDYYRAIEANRGFAQVARVEDLQPGDIIAVNYGTGHKPTGHVMMIDRVPAAHQSTSPVVPGLHQYEVAVIDSSNSGHGSLDTRFAGGRHTTGAGRGTLRLYAKADGTVAGYAWSTKRVSQFYPIANRQIAFGRFTGVPSDAAPKQPSTDADDVIDSQQ